MRRALAVLLTLMAAGAQAYTLSGKRWSSGTLTLQLQLGSVSGTLLDGRTSWNAVAEDALASWNAVLGSLQFAVVRDSAAATGRTNGLNNVLFSSTVYGTAWGNRVLAVTLTQYNTATLRYAEADVLFNSTLSWNSYRGALRTAAAGGRLQDLRRIALHEFGHVLGLIHPDESGQVVTAVMNSAVSDIDELQPDDIRGAQSLYGAAPVFPPFISSQPASQTAYLGSRVFFSVTATGEGTLAYQWRKDGAPLAGATQSVLTIASVTASDQGAYTAVVTNSGGSVTSNSAQLSVNVTATAPVLIVQPVSQTVAAGGSVTFTGAGTGTAPLAYQWRRNGVALPGATGTSLTLAGVAPGDSGAYSVVVSNPAGSATSNPATLTVTLAPPTLAAAPSSQTVIAGNPVTLAVAASGSEPLAYQWYRNGGVLAGATSARLTFTPVSSADAGAYAVVVTNAAGSARSPAADVVVHPASTLANLSVRSTLEPGATLIAGAVVAGGGKAILLRAAGPALERFGLTGLADPRLNVYGAGGTPLAENEDWPAALAATFTAAAAFPFPTGSRDAAVYQTFKDAFTAQVRGPGSGAVLLEAYDVAGGPQPRLVNLSTRRRVGTGADILIVGLALAGSGEKQVLIRAVGPGLEGFLISGVLADPVLKVFSASGGEIAANDNWEETLAPTFQRAGAFPLVRGSRDAALLLKLPAGSTYTIHVAGQAGGTGEALLEVYEIF